MKLFESVDLAEVKRYRQEGFSFNSLIAILLAFFAVVASWMGRAEISVTFAAVVLILQIRMLRRPRLVIFLSEPRVDLYLEGRKTSIVLSDGTNLSLFGRSLVFQTEYGKPEAEIRRCDFPDLDLSALQTLLSRLGRQGSIAWSEMNESLPGTFYRLRQPPVSIALVVIVLAIIGAYILIMMSAP